MAGSGYTPAWTATGSASSVKTPKSSGGYTPAWVAGQPSKAPSANKVKAPKPTPASQPTAPTPQQDPSQINSVPELKNALRTGTISHQDFINRFAVLTNSPIKPTAGMYAKDTGDAIYDTAKSIAQAPQRAAVELALTLQPKNTAKPGPHTNPAPSLDINSLPAASAPVPVKPTPAVATPSNAFTRALLGRAPVTSIQAQSEGAKTTHPDGFHVKGTPVTLTPRETGLAEAIGKPAIDVATLITTAKGVKNIADKQAAKTSAAKTTVKNAATNTLLNKVREADDSAPATPPAPSVVPGTAVHLAKEDHAGDKEVGAPKPANGHVPPKVAVKAPEVERPAVKPPKPTPDVSKEGEAGFADPGKMASDIQNLITHSRQTTKAGKGLSDDLFGLKQNTKADVDIATKILKSNKVSEADWEGAYHYAEDADHPVTPAQKELYDKVIQPLQQETENARALREDRDPNTVAPGSGVHRINIDKRGFVQDALNGKVRSSGGGLLRRSTSADKGRTMKAVTDEQGNRQVVSIKSPKDELGYAKGGKRVTAFNKGEAADLGTLKLKSKQDLLDREIKPYKAKLKALQKQWDALKNIKTTGGVSEARINSLARKTALLQDAKNFGEGLSKSEKRSLTQANLKLKELTRVKQVTTNAGARAAKVSQQIGEVNKALDDIHANYNPDELNDKVFVAKNGQHYTIGEATTKEIEANTNVRYSHHALLNTLDDFLRTRAAQRAGEFIDNWKTDPGFQEIAKKADSSDIPEHYIASTSPQFRGYYFEPKVAHVLDDFTGQIAKDPLEAITGINKFLTTTIFVNPLVHLPNEIASWAINRGASGFVNPVGVSRLIRTGGKAISEVVKQGPLYEQLQREGMPSMAYGNEEFNRVLNKTVAKQMEDPIVEKRLIKAGVAAPKRAAQLLMHGAHKATWVVQDILNTQAVLEAEAKGLSREEAIKDTFTTGKGGIPDYRPPTTLAGSRGLKKVVFNPNISVFSSYHYSILKSYMNTMSKLIAKDVSIKDRTTALDRAAMMGVAAFVIYPELDKLARIITGDPNGKFRRAGPLTVPYAIYQGTQGQKSPGDIVQNVITPPPGTKTALSLGTNRNSFGDQIYDLSDIKNNPKQFIKDAGGFALGQGVSPAGQIQRGIHSPRKVAASLIGISAPKSQLDNKINSLLNAQFGDGGMTVEQQRVAAAKAAARNQITSGKGDSLAQDLVNKTTKDGAPYVSPKNLPDFIASAKQTPTQRAFGALNTVNKAKVLASAKPADITKFGDLHALQVSASGTLNNKTSSPQSKQAARVIINKLGGDATKLYAEYKSQQKAKAAATRLSNKGVKGPVIPGSPAAFSKK